MNVNVYFRDIYGGENVSISDIDVQLNVIAREDQDVIIQDSRNDLIVRYQRSSPLDIWKLHQTTNPKCKEISVLGGVFGTIACQSFDYSSQLYDTLWDLLDMDINVTVVLPDRTKRFWHKIKDLEIDRERILKSVDKLKSICIQIKRERVAKGYLHKVGELELLEADLFRMVRLGLFADSMCVVNDSAKCHLVVLDEILQAQFSGSLTPYGIEEVKVRDIQRLLLVDYQTFKRLKDRVWKKWNSYKIRYHWLDWLVPQVLRLVRRK